MKANINIYKSKILTGVIYLYILLPVIIFLFGWCKIWLALLGAVIVGVSYILAVRKADELSVIVLKRKDAVTLIAAVIIILAWVFLSGVGGAVWQTSDHTYRNAIFDALVELPWPSYKEIVAGDSSQLRPLVYYIGFWLPSAAVGKLFGLLVGYLFQMVWAAAGIFLVYLLLCVWRKKVLLWPLFVLIFFSGLDIVGMNLLNENLIPATTLMHLEFWSGSTYQYSSNTTQLFWVFNQAVPAWLLIMLLWNQRTRENLVFAASTLVLASPFAFVGMLPIIFCYSIMGENWKDKRAVVKKYLREIFSFQNFFGGGFTGILCFLYLKSNIAVAYTVLSGTETSANAADTAVNAVELGSAVSIYRSLYERN